MTTRVTQFALASVALASLFACAATIHADEPALGEQAKLEFSMSETEAPGSDRFQLFQDIDITFLPGVWLPRMRGHITLGPSPAATPINIETGLDLRDMQATFLGELEISKFETFTLTFTGFNFTADGSGTFPFPGVFGAVTLAPGAAYTSDFELTSYSAELAVGVWRPFSALRGGPIDFSLSPMFAARYIDADISVMSGGATATAGGEWIAPLVGVRVEVNLYPNREIFLISGLKLDAAGALGPAIGGDGGFMYQVRAGITASITDNIGATFGYRLIDLDVEDGPLTLDTQLAGLFLGGWIRF
jgi:opacity protein-like surface antigen